MEAREVLLCRRTGRWSAWSARPTFDVEASYYVDRSNVTVELAMIHMISMRLTRLAGRSLVSGKESSRLTVPGMANSAQT
eukprot:6181349-Pleurochrysis_carterae.AAC.1